MNRRAQAAPTSTGLWTVTLAALLAIALAAPATAQVLSAPVLSNSSTRNELYAGLPGISLERTSGVETLSASPSSFQTRYFGLVSKDYDPWLGVGVTAAPETLVSDYGVVFSVTSPGAYVLTIATQRQGELHTVEDGGIQQNASADVTQLTCTYATGTLVSGTCDLPDPGVITNTNSSVPFNQTATAQICGVSRGSPISHILRFTWSQSASIPATSYPNNADEAAVRLGIGSRATGETAGDYPGTPARTESNDGHFVTVSVASLCGNGVIDTCGSASEQCDEGPANGAPGSCCDSDCNLRGSLGGSFVCRPSAGPCDVEDVCDGLHGACPADAFVSPLNTCRPAMDLCDVPELCSGSGAACPPDAVAPDTTVCRPAAAACDLAEVCDGTSPTCPADTKRPNTTICRPANGVCDLAESCDGASNDCPADSKRPNGALCRTAAGPCDIAENCDGSSNSCPPDALEPVTTTCRSVADACDVAESCTGSSPACPADTGLPDADGDAVCDALDNCDLAANPGQADGDGDSTGDACDPCNNLAPTVPVQMRLSLSRLSTPVGDDKFDLSGTLKLVPSTPTIDPLANGVRVALRKSATVPVIFDATIPGGRYDSATRVGWRRNANGTSFRYVDGSTAPISGIRQISMRNAGASDEWRLTVKGRDGGYDVGLAELPLRLTLVLQPPLAANGQCGESVFSAMPAAPPYCRFDRSGSRALCK